ncbi:MAG: hypothetical protein GXO89_07530 [Chlorobi bacterium]|nr:hypothetical protein [Chlorobiota bacterium]
MPKHPRTQTVAADQVAPGSGNTPVGGGAPLGGGLIIMMVMGAAYGSKKVFKAFK